MRIGEQTNRLIMKDNFITLYQSSPWLLAQADIGSSVDEFLTLLGKILIVIAVGMLLWSGLLFHDAKTREGVFALIGAFVFALAVPLARAIFRIGGW